MTAWLPLSLTSPMRSLRAAAGLSHAAAVDALSAAEGYPVPVSTLTSPELRGPAVQLGRLLARARAYGLDVEIRVRPAAKGTP